MDYTNTAKEILEKAGGKSNVSSATHCMTRLCLALKDESIVNDGEIKAIKGVVGLMLPAMLISNVGIGGVCAAIWLKSKNSSLKQLGFSSGVSAPMAGVTEPGLYGVVMPLKKPLLALIISNAVTGLIAGIMHVAATFFASPSLLALPIFVNAERSSNFFMAVACAAISIVLSFALTWVLGFEDPKEQ